MMRAAPFFAGPRVMRAFAFMAVLGGVFASAASGCGSDTSTFDEDGGASNSSGASGASGSSSSGGSSGTSGSSGSSGSSGTDGSSGSSGSSGTSSGEIDANIPDVSFIYDAPPFDGAVTQDSACAQTSATASLRPLDMFVILDRSGSMGTDCNVGDTTNSKWCYAINGLSQYFNSAGAAGNAAALQYFSNESGTCAGGTYDVSAVPGGQTGYTTLPAAAFDANLSATPKRSGTPTEGAIRGLTTFLARPANQRANRTTIGILITDGEPSSCDTNVTNLRNLLQAHYDATGIRTFVIGMTGASFSNLETIALGGNAPSHPDNVGGVTNACGNGNGPCVHWNIGDGNNGALAEALKAIQATVVGCTYQMPTTDAGLVNPDNVTVEYQQNGVPPNQALTRVNDASACVANGWYYDNNTAPTTINLCAAQCSVVQADPNAKVRVLLGCLGG